MRKVNRFGIDFPDYDEEYDVLDFEWSGAEVSFFFCNQLVTGRVIGATTVGHYGKDNSIVVETAIDNLSAEITGKPEDFIELKVLNKPKEQ